MSEFWKLIVTGSAITSVGLFVLELGKEYIKDRIKRHSDQTQKWREKRDEKRIGIYEQLYAKLDNATRIDGDSAHFEAMIQEIELFVKTNNLYIDDGIESLIYDFTDYLRDVITESVYRDIEKEASFLKKFKNKFNK